MQGFVTCTTFTTWHHGFRWDSANPALDLLDHAPPPKAEHAAAATATAAAAAEAEPRVDDAVGSLSMELQAQHSGA